MGALKVFFATDIHGSEVCWRKFLNSAAFYKADLVVLGGDVTGKVMVPIVAHPGYWQVTVRGQALPWRPRRNWRKSSARSATRVLPGDRDPGRAAGPVPTEGAVDRRFTAEMTRSLDRWLDMADGKLRGGDDTLHPQRRKR